MLMGVRIYPDESGARRASEALVAAGLDPGMITVLIPGASSEAATVQTAIEARRLPESHRKAATAALGRGQAVLSVDLPYESQVALDIMEAHGAVDTASLPQVPPRDPSPLSDALGLPVLTSSRSTTQLAPSHQFMLGFGALLTRSQGPTFGGNLTGSQSAPDRSLGFPTLSKNQKGPDRSFGFPTLLGK